MSFLTKFRNNGLKERILKNRENVLDVFSSNMNGAKACPLLMGQKCIGKLCMFFNEYKDIDRETKKEREYFMCDYNATPKLLMELNANIREFIDAIKKGTQ